MGYSRIKSFAKINLALNVTGKNSRLHKIESIVGFVSLYDVILIKEIQSKKHIISFNGKYSKNIHKKNTISKLLNILEKKKLITGHKFEIKVNKHIPSKSGLGGGSMNAANNSIMQHISRCPEVGSMLSAYTAAYVRVCTHNAQTRPNMLADLLVEILRLT